MTSQFDTLPATYEDFTATRFRTCLEIPSVRRALGDLGGAAVLDLGCGSGVYTRWVRRHGAARATGLDVSAGMIGHARAQEAADPVGVDYVLGALPDHLAGTFDLVLGVYVLPYATTHAELRQLCDTAAHALRPGGRFVTLPIHPGFRPGAVSYTSYGFRLTAREPLADGSPVTLNLCFQSHDETVTARFWTRATLEGTLRAAGFTCPRWTDPTVSEEGIAEHGEPYWRDYLTHPHMVITDCVKAGSGT
ncbi:class I SAM-dependent methyltransferase [Streptomyces sp. NPDC101227]|uniref:class I SAM-dependent methyltransferase n=1 Tax=Streptomyces sp. NPDC101227 TaxID=3366136 RepID=UPI0037F56302